MACHSLVGYSSMPAQVLVAPHALLFFSEKLIAGFGWNRLPESVDFTPLLCFKHLLIPLILV